VEGFCEHGDELSDSMKCKISFAAAEPVAPKHWFYFMDLVAECRDLARSFFCLLPLTGKQFALR
jgi:hypothetical protein